MNNDVMVSDPHTELAAEKEELMKCLLMARALRDKLESSLDNMDRSIEMTKNSLDRRMEAVVEWMQTYILALDNRVQQLRLQAREGIKHILLTTQQHVTYLSQLTNAMAKALKGQGVSHQHVAQLYMEYQKHHRGHFLSCQQLGEMLDFSERNQPLMVLMGGRPDDCKRAIEHYLGLPFLSRILRPTPPSQPWSFTIRLSAFSSQLVSSASKTSTVLVADILPESDGSISVLYRHDESSLSFTLAHYTPDGVNCMERAIEGCGEMVLLPPQTEGKLCSIISLPPVFCVSSESWQQQETFVSNSQVGKHPTSHTVLYIKSRGKNKTCQVCQMAYPRSGQSSLKPSVLLTLDYADATTVTSSADHHYLAVLRKCQAIHVYQLQNSSASLLSLWDVTGQLPGLRVRSMCWGKLRQQDVLMVAESVYSALLLLDPIHGCALTTFLPSPCPHPTCLRSDVTTGILWVGCEGGEVLEGMPECQDGEMEEEDGEDEDGYMIPSVLLQRAALYQNQSTGNPLQQATPRPSHRNYDRVSPVRYQRRNSCSQLTPAGPKLPPRNIGDVPLTSTGLPTQHPPLPPPFILGVALKPLDSLLQGLLPEELRTKEMSPRDCEPESKVPVPSKRHSDSSSHEHDKKNPESSCTCTDPRNDYMNLYIGITLVEDETYDSLSAPGSQTSRILEQSPKPDNTRKPQQIENPKCKKTARPEDPSTSAKVKVKGLPKIGTLARNSFNDALKVIRKPRDIGKSPEYGKLKRKNTARQEDADLPANEGVATEPALPGKTVLPTQGLKK